MDKAAEIDALGLELEQIKREKKAVWEVEAALERRMTKVRERTLAIVGKGGAVRMSDGRLLVMGKLCSLPEIVLEKGQ